MTHRHANRSRLANRNATFDTDDKHFTGNAVVQVGSHMTEAEAIYARMVPIPRPPTPKPVTIRRFSWEEGST